MDDFQLCVRKIPRLLSQNCVAILKKRPLITLLSLFLLTLYIFFPFVFWVLVHSVPIVVCSCIAFAIRFGKGEEGWDHRESVDTRIKSGRESIGTRIKSDVVDQELVDTRIKSDAVDRESVDTRIKPDVVDRVHGNGNDDGNGDGTGTSNAIGDGDGDGNDKNNNVVKSKKSMSRVHSVRRRRAKDIWKDESAQQNRVVDEKSVVPLSLGDNSQKNGIIEEKTAIPSSNYDNGTVDKSAVAEEIPKEIHEVEVDRSVFDRSNAKISFLSALKRELSQGSRMKGIDELGSAKSSHKMDMNVENTKRLENLIARRRSRNLLSLHVRRALMNLDRKDSQGHIPSLHIPKLGNGFYPNNMDDPFSPIPGSAPSVLLPMQNPFDIPYDPYEEKPNLTEDSFGQEFIPSGNKEPVYCRHQSFNLRYFSPANYDETQRDIVFESDDGFRQRLRSENEITPKSESPTDEDHIKEIIHQSGKNKDNQEDGDNNAQMRQNPSAQEETTATSNSSQSSSEEEDRIFKIDKEAILKSLSSMARRSVAVEEFDDDDGGSYYDERAVRRHTPSYSIASDMQVEVSEISSPPPVIDENFPYHEEVSYQDENSTTYDFPEHPMTPPTPVSNEDITITSSMESEEKHCVEPMTKSPPTIAEQANNISEDNLNIPVATISQTGDDDDASATNDEHLNASGATLNQKPNGNAITINSQTLISSVTNFNQTKDNDATTTDHETLNPPATNFNQTVNNDATTNYETLNASTTNFDQTTHNNAITNHETLNSVATNFNQTTANDATTDHETLNATSATNFNPTPTNDATTDHESLNATSATNFNQTTENDDTTDHDNLNTPEVVTLDQTPTTDNNASVDHYLNDIPTTTLDHAKDNSATASQDEPKGHSKTPSHENEER